MVFTCKNRMEIHHAHADHLKDSNVCGFRGNSIFDAISSVRDILAHSQVTEAPLYILPLHFNNVFDSISQQYLFHVLGRYGISQWIIDTIHALYDQTTSYVQINGVLTGHISFQSGIRPGCSICMVLYALCLHPLIRSPEDILSELRIGWSQQFLTVLAYTDDMNGFVTQLRLSSRYFRQLGALERQQWLVSIPQNRKTGNRRMDGTCDNVRNRVPRSSRHTWSKLQTHLGALRDGQLDRCRTRCACSSAIRLHLKLVLGPEITLCQNIFSCKNLILHASLPSIPRACSATHERLLMVHLARGNFSGPHYYPSTSKTRRLLELPKPWGEIQVSLYNRIHVLAVKVRSVISELMRHWKLTGILQRPPSGKRIPSTLVYLRQYGLDMACVTTYAPGETRQKFKRIV